MTDPIKIEDITRCGYGSTGYTIECVTPGGKIRYLTLPTYVATMDLVTKFYEARE